ncbi:MAG: sodium ion-translocating decarboxylase subunit beta [Clostridiales bacterium]|nr:sodium ion-translocating decarboxylase subunit beta [Clostridiales bacterium]
MEFLVESIMSVDLITWLKYLAMWVIGGVLIWLAIKKEMEPALLLPMGFGCILVNIPLSNVLDLANGGYICTNPECQHTATEIVTTICVKCGSLMEENVTAGVIDWLFDVGIHASEAMPILLFIGIGAMIDFGPLLTNPKLFILGGAAQFGIFLTVVLAVVCGFDIKDAASIGIIGAADGPTSILVAMKLGSKFVGPIMVVAYSYMALVPIIQPVVIKCTTTKKERAIKMHYSPKQVSKGIRILFPIIVTVIAGLIAPSSLALIGFLMFGNLIRECGVLGTMTDTASNNLANLITLLLGITIASQLRAEEFISWETLMIIGLGLFAFIFDTIAGIVVAKVMNLFSKEKINPMIGAAGISAFPMAARTVQKMAIKENPSNHLLMHAIGANVSGQIASAIVGGLILGLL